MISRRNQGKIFGEHDIALGISRNAQQPGRRHGSRDDRA
jgi:hypothetical protein